MSTVRRARSNATSPSSILCSTGCSSTSFSTPGTSSVGGTVRCSERRQLRSCLAPPISPRWCQYDVRDVRE
jgi:hypothetical protein